MSQQAVMWATFCDDVRQELGNKLSLMGVYGPDLIVQSFPTTLPKLCCLFNIRIPIEQSPRKKIVFRLQRDEEVIFQAELTPPTEDPAKELAPRAEDASLLWMSFVAQLANFEVAGPAILRARAIIDEQEVRGGILRLQAATQPSGQ